MNDKHKKIVGKLIIGDKVIDITESEMCTLRRCLFDFIDKHYIDNCTSKVTRHLRRVIEGYEFYKKIAESLDKENNFYFNHYLNECTEKMKYAYYKKLCDIQAEKLKTLRTLSEHECDKFIVDEITTENDLFVSDEMTFDLETEELTRLFSFEEVKKKTE